MPGTEVDPNRVRSLIDKDDIRELLFRYAAAVDGKQWSAWEACFSEEAEVLMPFASHSGRAGLGAWAAASLAPFALTEHLYGNIQVKIEGEHATGRSNFWAACTHSGDDLSRHFDEGGYYQWRFARTATGWLISRLELSVTWTTGADAAGLSNPSSAGNTARSLSDREQIQWALDDYGYGIDRRDAEQWLRAWHPDAVFDVDHPRRTCRGHADLLDWAKGVWADFEILNHITTNEQISFTGPATAAGLGRAIALFVMADGTYVSAAALYDDKFELRDGVWRLSYRKVDVNHLAQMNDARIVRYPGRIAHGQ